MRYLLFAFYHPFPAGGWNDFQGSYNTVEDAKEAAQELDRKWCQVIDLSTLKVACLGGLDKKGCFVWAGGGRDMRYLLFAGDYYYPGGGWGDFKGSYDTAEEAKSAAEKLTDDWFEIADLSTERLKWSGEWDSAGNLKWTRRLGNL